MFRTGRLLVDRQRALEQRLGVGVAALLLVQRRQIVQGLPDIGMTWRQRLFAHRQRPLEQRFGIGIALLPLIQRRQIVQFGAIADESRPAAFSRIAIERFSSGSASASLP